MSCKAEGFMQLQNELEQVYPVLVQIGFPPGGKNITSLTQGSKQFVTAWNAPQFDTHVALNVVLLCFSKLPHNFVHLGMGMQV